MFPSDLLSVEVASGNINKKDGNSTEFPGALNDTEPDDFANLMEFFREAEFDSFGDPFVSVFFRVGL
jgi:hypothetical protein